MHNISCKSATLLLTLSLALGLSACNHDVDKPSSTTSSRPNTVILSNGAEPDSLDPHKSSDFTIIRQLLVGLVQTNNEGQTVPWLAEKWESSDGKIWTFHLRDAKWSNGDPVTAEDFVYSLRRLTNPKTASPYINYLGDLHVKNAEAIATGKMPIEELGVKAIDPKTLQITLTSNVPYFIDALTLGATFAVHKATVEKFGDKWTTPQNFIGNNAYKLKEWVVNDHITLQRNPTYFDNAKTSIEKAIFLPVVGQAEYNEYRTDAIDIAMNAPPEQYQNIKSIYKDEMHSVPALCTFYYEVNHKAPMFTDPRVVKALSMALDRNILTDKVLGRGEKPTYQLTPPYTKNMSEAPIEWKNWDMNKRVTEAKKLLAEAGYTPAHPLKFEFLYNTNETAKRLVNASAALWKERLNVEVTTINQEPKTIFIAARSGKYHMSFNGWCADYNDPSSFLNAFKSKSDYNTGKFNSVEFDQTMAQTLADGVSAEQRSKLYQQAEQILDKEGATIPIYNRVNIRLIKPYIEGYSMKDPTENWHISNWKIKH